MDLFSRLFIFSPMKENKKFTNVFTRTDFRVSGIKISDVVAKETIAADTVASTETAI